MKFKRQDLFSFYSHFSGAVLSLFGMLVLVYRARVDLALSAIVALYGLSAVFMLSSSAIYHASKSEEDASSFIRRMDHFAIFCMIAGTYTPLCFIYLEGGWRLGIIIAQWALVVAGFFLKIFYIKAPRVFSTIVYLLMGWMALIPIREFMVTAPALVMALVFAGGVMYSIGAVFYMIKRPNPAPGFFGFHEIFHLFILGGVGTHFAAIYLAVTARAALI